MGEDCIMCQAVSEKIPTFKIYEDEKAVAFLSERPASVGHVIIVPKQHFPILEGTPDYIAGHLLVVANKISMALFEAFGAQGTNILIQNGVAAGQDTPHLMVHVIARLPDDKLNFQWPARQLSEEQMSTIELSIKDKAKSIGNFEKEKPKPVNLDSLGKSEIKRALEKEEKKEEKAKEPKEEKNEPPKKEDAEENNSKEENYLIKQLRRMP